MNELPSICLDEMNVRPELDSIQVPQTQKTDIGTIPDMIPLPSTSPSPSFFSFS